MMRLFRAEIAFLNGIDCYSWPCSRCFNSSCCCFAFSIIHFWVRHQRICIPSLALLFLINFLSVCLFHSHRFIDFSPFFFSARGKRNLVAFSRLSLAASKAAFLQCIWAEKNHDDNIDNIKRRRDIQIDRQWVSERSRHSNLLLCRYSDGFFLVADIAAAIAKKLYKKLKEKSKIE